VPKRKPLGNWLLEILSGFAVDPARKNGKSKSRSVSRDMAALALQCPSLAVFMCSPTWTGTLFIGWLWLGLGRQFGSRKSPEIHMPSRFKSCE
jgi:hypothetical protein